MREKDHARTVLFRASTQSRVSRSSRCCFRSTIRSNRHSDHFGAIKAEEPTGRGSLRGHLIRASLQSVINDDRYADQISFTCDLSSGRSQRE